MEVVNPLRLRLQRDFRSVSGILSSVCQFFFAGSRRTSDRCYEAVAGNSVLAHCGLFLHQRSCLRVRHVVMHNHPARRSAGIPQTTHQ